MKKVTPKPIKQIVDELDARRNEIESERATVRQVDEQWEKIKKHQESKSLGKLSHVLISIYGIAKLWASLKEGESLVLNSDGSIYKGRPNLEKLTLQQERYTTEKAEHNLADSDPSTRSAIGFSKSNVFSAYNNWDSRTRVVNPDGTTKRGGRKSEPTLEPDFF